MKPNIFVVGPSGSGKSTSIRNLDPKTTAIINIEQKALPFKGAKKFEMNVACETIKQVRDALKKAITSDKVEVIVIESFTALTEAIYREASETYSGFDLWKEYNEDIDAVLHMSKNTEKYIIFLGIDQVIESDTGVDERYVQVQGNRWKKSVEKEFVIVAYTDVHTNDDGETQYRFVTNKTKGFTNVSAKSPMDMLPTIMKNDLNQMILMIEDYYNEENED